MWRMFRVRYLHIMKNLSNSFFTYVVLFKLCWSIRLSAEYVHILYRPKIFGKTITVNFFGLLTTKDDVIILI